MSKRCQLMKRVLFQKMLSIDCSRTPWGAPGLGWGKEFEKKVSVDVCTRQKGT
ncbi:hypothetical protein RUM44_002124 [Polyplax serrata]|uniref:Uncharacterized protein n=1 Tax=Polyplax serrata TaxID=468196 RepID=A0ABR1ALZ8_POLSC